jgi:hypothetical protein
MALYDTAGRPRSGGVTAALQGWHVVAGMGMQLTEVAAVAPLATHFWLFLTYTGNNWFTLTLLNRAEGYALSPGVVVLQQGASALFQTGRIASAGLVTLARDGNPYPLYQELK